MGNAVRTAVLSGALTVLGLASAYAEEAAEQGNPAVLQEVVVTGSRIPVPANISATSPLTVVSSQSIELQGQTDATDVINMLPQNIISSGVDFGNQSNSLAATGGFSTVDLRGLGPQRTLVLVDGRRLGAGDPSTTNPNPAPDIDQIPAPLIERVEVVTGGASATYGSDAIAGVVNFIMKKNFQGVQIDGQYGFAQHNEHNSFLPAQESAIGITPPTGSIQDGYKHDVSIVMGTNTSDGAGNVTGYFVYHNQQSVPGSARDFSDCEAVSNDPIGYQCLGSSNSNRFQLVGAGTTRYTVVGNQFLPWPQAGSVPPPDFNFNGFEYIQREDERYQGGLMAHLDVNDYAKPYLQFSFMNDKTNEVVAPSGLFVGGNTATGDGNYPVNCSNPLLSAQEQAAICTPAQIAADTAVPGSASANLAIGRRNIEGGGRAALFEHINYRGVVGITGNIFSDAWTYDAYGQYYYTAAYNQNNNYLNYASITNALQATGTAANPTCISGKPCVPYNIFTQGGVTPQQLAYLYTPGSSYGTNSEQVMHADVTGDLGKWNIVSPWAKDGPGINVGLDHRFEALSFSPDAAELAGNLAGFSGAVVPLTAGYAVTEGFGEFRAPLIQNKPGAYDLTVDAGYRYSNYTTGVLTNTYKFEVQYAPLPDVRLRYSYDRAVRAPNLIELYNPQSFGQEQVVTTDPCAPTLTSGGVLVPATASLASCLHTGVTAAQYGNGSTTSAITQCIAGQCGQVLGGNAKLQPEIGYTYSLGITLTPTFLPNFSASVDYYHINLQGQVGAIPENVILQNCLATGDPKYCGLIVRTPGGSLTGSSVQSGGYFLQTAINTGASLVSGYDLEANYRWHLGSMGSLTANLVGTWLQHTTSTPYPGAHTYDCAGLFGATCGGGSVNPTWRHNLRVNWQTPWNLLLSAQWRYISGTGFDNNSNDPSLHFNEEGAYDVLNARIANYSYLDLSAEWKVWKNIELRGGVNNVLDKDPPFIPEADITGNSGPMNSYQTYDLLGRELFIAIRAKF
ncbi:MAG: TonB-dependent receptor domain-containing protein [Steroidobacterales bacterium]